MRRFPATMASARGKTVVREKFGRQFIRYAIEQYGSEAHLAEALGVTREQLLAWKRGEAEAPPELLQALADLLRRDGRR